MFPSIPYATSLNGQCDTSTPSRSIDKLRLDSIMGLRIMEHLGRSYPSTFSTAHPLEHILTQILNWISLCIVSNSTRSYCDVAVATSTQPGIVVLHIATGRGAPSRYNEKNAALFLETLRRAFFEDLVPPLIIRNYLLMLAERSFPQILRKMAMIASTDEAGPAHMSDRFYALVSIWLKHHPTGEQSAAFVSLANNSEWGGGGGRATDLMIDSLVNLLYQDIRDPMAMSLEDRYQYLVSTSTTCLMLIGSSFFGDFIRPLDPFRMALDISDVLFLHELLRRLVQVANYQSGSSEFAYRGVPYLKRVLGFSGMAAFMKGMSGIVINWVGAYGHTTGMTVQCPINPSEKVLQVLALDCLDLDHLDNEMREYVAQTETVTNAWKKGDVITLHIHSELRMISYLQKHGIDVMDYAIGLSRPMCWACHCYIKKLNSSPGWSIAQTSGQSRDDWCLPPCRPDIALAFVRAVDKKVERVIEHFALECYP